MSKMLEVAPGFQYSVNIGYDLNHDDKLKNFIPTKSSLQLLKEILLSTRPDSTERIWKRKITYCPYYIVDADAVRSQPVYTSDAED